MIEPTIIDIPVPPSVNKTRRINFAALPAVKAWKEAADKELMASGQYKRAVKIKGQYELTIVLSETLCAADQDNPIKAAIDYLRRIELIENDDPRHARRTIIEWGEAPKGCRLILRPYVKEAA